jgi:hypothetical protein
VEWVTGLFGSSSDKVKEHQERMEEHAKKIDEVLYTLNNGTVVSREAWTQWSDDVQQSVEDILNPLDRAREQSTLTFDQLKSNLEDNQKFFEGWANNLAILADRGFTALAFEMQQLGPEAETAVGQMINMSDSKLAEMEALFAERGKTIGGSGVSQIADALAGADWSGLGRYIAIAIGVDLDQKLNAIMEETLTNLREQGATIGVTFGTTVSRATPGVRQHGGPVFPGRPYIVGEHRPELFIPGQVGYVAPRVPMGGTTVINISPVIQAGVVTPNLGEEIAALLKREIDRGGPLGLS